MRKSIPTLLTFCLLAILVKTGATQALDEKLLLSIPRPPALLEIARDITALGSDPIVILITLLLVFAAKPRLLLPLLAVLTALPLNPILKSLFNRPRPDLVPHATSFSNSSFPSGHALMSAVTYLTLGFVFSRRMKTNYPLAVAIFLTLLIGVSRVILGVHWPTDVLAGWAAGATWAILWVSLLS